MKKLAIVVLALAIPVQAMAMTAKDLLSLVAMPLAVAAVSDLAHVPQDQLASLVSQLNQANVPPDQFVQVLRYTPPALVVPASPQVPTLVQFVDNQTSRGITGPALITAVQQQLPVYGVTPVFVTDVPATTLVTETDYIPSNVMAQLGGTSNPLALIAMPLAVAAVSDLTGVPQDQLASLVASLNQANVPPAGFVQVLRYAPVALVADTSQPQFVEFVQNQTSQGLTGPALITVINQQLPTYGVTPQPAFAPTPQTVVVDHNYFPPVVMTRMAQAERNPHGGPPGQLKKIEGLQTGAEVVHGGKNGRQFGAPASPIIVAQPRVNPHGRGEGERVHGNPHGMMPPGQAKRMEIPPMTSAAPERRMPPGQAKKIERQQPPQIVPQAIPVPQAAPPAGMPPGQAKKQGGPPGQGNKGGEGHGHGHGKD